MKRILTDKKKNLRQKTHLTRPPRMEGKIKNAKMNPVKKQRKNTLHSLLVKEPEYIITDIGYEKYSEGDGFGERIEDSEY